MSTVTTFAARTGKPRRAGATADAVIASAVDVAREAAVGVGGVGHVGEHEGLEVEGQRIATHYFTSTAPGYRGWRWAVTLARAPRAKTATVCEVSLLAGEESLVAPPWVPWVERLQPGDVRREDVLPYSADDHRLMPGYAATGDVDADRLALYELGLGRPRVLSPEGRAEASERWYTGVHGPVELATDTGDGGRRRQGRVLGHCSTCGFLVLMAGSMRTAFGVCANEWSPDDGQVVSMDHGCGAHSETGVLDGRHDWPENAPVIDDLALEMFDHAPALRRRPRGGPAGGPAAGNDEDGPGEGEAGESAPDADGAQDEHAEP